MQQGDKQISVSMQLDDDRPSGVVVLIDGAQIMLTREQEALIRAWASGPV